MSREALWVQKSLSTQIYQKFFNQTLKRILFKTKETWKEVLGKKTLKITEQRYENSHFFFVGHNPRVNHSMENEELWGEK